MAWQAPDKVLQKYSRIGFICNTLSVKGRLVNVFFGMDESAQSPIRPFKFNMLTAKESLRRVKSLEERRATF